MKVILFGGTGMVGQGVLLACVKDPRVEQVLVVVRKAGGLGVGAGAAKVVEMVQCDFFNWSGVEDRFLGYDVCFFCLGASAVGMNEAEYRRLTYELTLGVAEMLVRVGSVKTLVYVSGAGTNEHGRQMWARVKGETESALLRLPIEWVFCFRPGVIQPMNGIRSKTRLYQAIYSATGWMYPLLRRMFPGLMTSTEEVGDAMIAVAGGGYQKRVLEVADIRAAAGGPRN